MTAPLRRIIVTGGRAEPTAAKRVPEVLSAEHAKDPIWLVIHGNYGATDNAADKWADDNGVPALPMDADWNTYGPAAGPIRNGLMVKRLKDLCWPNEGEVFAFKGGRGTADCKEQARRAGIPVKEFADDQIDAPVCRREWCRHYDKQLPCCGQTEPQQSG